MTPSAFEIYSAWASDLAGQFQRASSAVEGRNGYLSQLNHCARGTPPQRLKVMTVIHNFDLKRTDGTTAAERLFKTSFPDLFDWMVERMAPLPVPRKPRAGIHLSRDILVGCVLRTNARAPCWIDNGA